MSECSKLKKSAYSPIVFYLLPFLVLGSYLTKLVVSGELHGVDGYYLIHYLYTYKKGFIARGLVGEVLSHFFDTITYEITYTVVLVFSVLLLISSVLCIGRALTKVKDDRERFTWVLALIILLCIMPITFRTYFIDTKLDKLLWALTFFAVLLSENKLTIWFVPALCITATLVNPVFLFCSMILIAIILLQKFADSGFSFKNGLICFISYAAMIFIGIYGPIKQQNLGFESVDELIHFYFQRNASGLPEEYDRFATEWLFDYFEPLKNMIKMAYDIYFVNWGNGIADILNFIFVALPIYSVLTAVWIKIIKTEENRFQKFIFFLCAISPVVLIVPIVISWEASKYFGNNLIVHLCLIIYYTVNGNKAVTEVLGKIKNFCKNNLVLTSAGILYLALYLK